MGILADDASRAPGAAYRTYATGPNKGIWADARNATCLREELQMMHDFVLLPMAYAIAEKNRRQVTEKARSLHDLFVIATDIVLGLMHADLEETKQTLKRANITVIARERIDSVASYSYKCRSHNGAFAITREYARDHIGKMIGRYINGLF